MGSAFNTCCPTGHLCSLTASRPHRRQRKPSLPRTLPHGLCSLQTLLGSRWGQSRTATISTTLQSRLRWSLNSSPAESAWFYQQKWKMAPQRIVTTSTTAE